MGFWDHFSLEDLIERIMQHIDIEAIAAEVMPTLKIEGLDVHFVVQPLPDSDNYDFIGLAYGREAAEELWLEHSKKHPCKIFRLDMGKLVELIEKLGGVEEVR